MNAVKLSPSEFAKELGASPMPVLFPDTCALLDILRLPVRKPAATVRKELAAVRAIINAASGTNAAMHILIPEQVEREWQENISGVEAEVNKAITLWANQAEQFESALSHFGGPGIPPKLDDPCRRAVVDLKGMATEIFARAILLSDDDACLTKALQRVLRGTAPAQKGKQVKDCVIIEHVLEAMRIVRARSSRICVFLSSNTRDYRQTSSSTLLRPPLDADFVATDLAFCTDWHWAANKLAV